MKKVLLLSLTIFSFYLADAQNVGIGTTSPGAKLDISSTNSGILIPRVALTGTASALPLTTPATSTMVYNTATAGAGATAITPGFYYWNSTSWVRVIDAASLTGATTVSNTSSVNNLTTTVNGVTGSTVTIVNSNTLTQSGANITNTVNGIGATVTPALTGDVSGALNSTSVNKINGTSMAGLGTGILKNTTGTGVPSIAVAADFPTLPYVDLATTQTAAGIKTWSSAANFSGGTVNMTNGTSNILTFNQLGLGNPTFTSSTPGTKVLFYPNEGATTVDYAMGVNTNLLWYSVPQANSTFSHIFYGGTTELMRVRGDGNVGIGTTAPLIKLDLALNNVIGTSATSVTQHDVSNIGTKISIGAVCSNLISEFAGMKVLVAPGTNGCGNTGDVVFNTWECNTSISREVMRINGTGRVGIGNSAPAYPLDVNGVINAATGYKVAGAAATGTYLRGNGTTFVGSAIQASDLSLGINGTINTVPKFTAANSIGNSSITDNGTTVASGEPLTINAGATQLSLIVNGSTSNEIALQNAGTTKLDIGYAIAANNYITGSAAGDIAIRQAGGGKILFSSSSGGATNDLTLSGGNVGVGTSTPGSPLTVRTTVATANAREASLANAIGDPLYELATSRGATTNNPGDVMTQVGQAYNGGTISEGIRYIRGSSSTDGAMAFVTNAGTERMRILSNGFVGIGTSSPQVGLEVDASLSATFARFGFANPVYIVANSPMIGFNALYNGGFVYGASSSYGGMINFSQDISGGFSFTTAPLGTAGAAAALTSRMAITNAGNVGIGTTAPATKLHIYTTTNGDGIEVDGNVSVGYSLATSGTVKASIGLATGAGSWSTDAAAGDLIMRTNFAKILFNTNNGAGGATMTVSGSNVGVGTNAPLAALDITSTTSGFLPPRMTTAQRNAIAAPVAGLTVYTTENGCLNIYNGSNWALNCPSVNTATFSYSGSIVTWTVPANIYSVNIEAKGASGGFNSTQGGSGGLGADVKGVFNVTPGQVLSILVGQSPGNWNTSGVYFPAGGGATYVALGAAYASSTAWLVAGAGGGGYSTTGGSAGLAVTSGAGTGGTATNCGGGGGGFTGNGATDASNGTGTNATGGKSFVNGGAGATYTNGGSYFNQNGGFGGGATADYNSSCNTQAGAGGGYVGGNGQSTTALVVAGNGGGSYILSTATLQLNTINNTGNGSVVITY